MTVMRRERTEAPKGTDVFFEVSDLVFSVGDKVRVGPISLRVARGEAVGVVGESGAGKSLLCRALTGMLGYYGGTVNSGSIRFDSRVLSDGVQSSWDHVRRSGIGFVPQASLSGLNPMRNVGAHFKEILTKIDDPHRISWKSRAIDLLEKVQLVNPALVLTQYGHQLSGGMQQRVMLALTLATNPRLLIADEPTTALDATVARQILQVLRTLREQDGLAIIVVSHDLAVIEQICDRIHVMYAGRIVESGQTVSVLRDPLHPYSAALMATDPSAVPFGEALAPIPGEPPAASKWQANECSFAVRCLHATSKCHSIDPPPEPSPHGGIVSCLRWKEIKSGVAP